MLINPFTPSQIAADADQFFGREPELAATRVSLPIGSVLIQGPIGIGKSSLLARTLDMMAALDCDTHVVVADPELKTVESLARVILDSLIEENEGDGKLRLKFGFKMFGVEVESKDAVKDIREGRNLAALKRILEADHKRRTAANRQLLIIAIDEADKTPALVARLVRSVWTHCQQVGVNDVRFAIAGVSPVHQEMVKEDQGIERAFNRVLTLTPMTSDETNELLVAKFTAVLRDAKRQKVRLNIEQQVIDRIGALSGGHPHIVQLLGSHIIQHENLQPDGILTVSDLMGVLQRICYDDRKATYAATLHMLENAGKLNALSMLLRPPTVEEGFPTRIYRGVAVKVVDPGDIQWFVEHDVLVPRSTGEYGLVDEFIRVRLAFDAEKPELRAEMEAELVAQGRLLSWDEMQDYYGRGEDDDEPRME